MRVLYINNTCSITLLEGQPKISLVAAKLAYFWLNFYQETSLLINLTKKSASLLYNQHDYR